MDPVIHNLHAHALAYYVARISGRDFSESGSNLVSATMRLCKRGVIPKLPASPFSKGLVLYTEFIVNQVHLTERGEGLPLERVSAMLMDYIVREIRGARL